MMWDTLYYLLYYLIVKVNIRFRLLTVFLSQLLFIFIPRPSRNRGLSCQQEMQLLRYYAAVVMSSYKEKIFKSFDLKSYEIIKYLCDFRRSRRCRYTLKLMIDKNETLSKEENTKTISFQLPKKLNAATKCNFGLHSNQKIQFDLKACMAKCDK